MLCASDLGDVCTALRDTSIEEPSVTVERLAIELSVKAEDVNELEGLGDNVGSLVSQLDAMRQALDDPALKLASQPSDDLA